MVQVKWNQAKAGYTLEIVIFIFLPQVWLDIFYLHL